MIGIVSTMIDAIFYFALIQYAMFELSIAKGISFIAGTINSYFLNRAFTFKSNIPHTKGLIKHFALYGFSLIINVSTNNLIFNALNGFQDDFSIKIAFLIATTLSVAINFIGLKFFVHKN